MPKRKSGVMKDNPESAAVVKAEARYQVILNDMHRTGSVSVDALAEQLQVTVDRVHKQPPVLGRPFS